MNNGYFGIQSNNIFGSSNSLGISSTQSSSSSLSSGAKTASAIGGGLNALSSIMSLFSQNQTRDQLYQQANLATTQYNLQLNQIDANQSIADVNALQQANSTYGSQLTSAGASGISMQSSAIANQLNNTVKNQQIASFGNNMTATLQKMNASYNQVNTLEQIQSAENASSMSSIGSLISGGVGLASLAILFI